MESCPICSATVAVTLIQVEHRKNEKQEPECNVYGSWSGNSGQMKICSDVLQQAKNSWFKYAAIKDSPLPDSVFVLVVM